MHYAKNKFVCPGNGTITSADMIINYIDLTIPITCIIVKLIKTAPTMASVDAVVTDAEALLTELIIDST